MSAQDNVRMWGEHTRGEFITKDVHLALSTMVFIPSIPEEWDAKITNRVVTENTIVEETRTRFRHTKRMDWFLPGEPPSGKIIEIDAIFVIEFRDGLMSAERLYWDVASALRQIGKL